MTTATTAPLDDLITEEPPQDKESLWQWAIRQYSTLNNVSRWASWERGRVAFLACGEDQQSIRAFAAEVGDAKSVVAQAVSNYKFFMADPEYVKRFFMQGGTLKLLDVARRSASEIGELMDEANAIVNPHSPKTNINDLAYDFIQSALGESKSANKLRDELKEQASILRHRIAQAKGQTQPGLALSLYNTALSNGYLPSWRDYGAESEWGPWGGVGHDARLPGKLVIDVLAMTKARKITVLSDNSDVISEICQELGLEFFSTPVYTNHTIPDVLAEARVRQPWLLSDTQLFFVHIPPYNGAGYDPNGLTQGTAGQIGVNFKRLMTDAAASAGYQALFAVFVRDGVDVMGEYENITQEIVWRSEHELYITLEAKLMVHLPDYTQPHTEPAPSLIKHGELLLFRKK